MNMQLQNATEHRTFANTLSMDETPADVATLLIGPEHRAAMTNAFGRLPDPYRQARQFLPQALSGVMHMGTEALSQLMDFAVGPNAPAALFLDGLPTDSALPATPDDGEPAEGRKSYIGEAVTLGLARVIGEPIGYVTEKSGQILHNLIPVRGAEKTQSNRSSSVFLSFHNDSVYDESQYFHVFNPDFLVLYGHRADPAGAARTLYISARTIVDHLDTADIAILRQPLFQMAAPSNFTNLMRNGEKIWSNPVPILFGRDDLPEIAVGANGVTAITAEAQGALERLQALCQRDDLHTSVGIGAGQALIVNNRKGLHARTPFEPSYGPDERWLLRANVRRDVWSMRDRWTGRDLVFQ